MTDHIEYTQEKASIRYQAKQILLDLQQVVNSKNWLDGESKITYLVPLVKSPTGKTLTCKVSLTNNSLEINVEGEESFNYSVRTISNAKNFAVNCGEKIEIMW